MDWILIGKLCLILFLIAGNAFFVGAEIKMIRYFYLIPENVVNFKDFMTATTSSVTNVDIYSIVDYYDDRFQKAWEVLAQ